MHLVRISPIFTEGSGTWGGGPHSLGLGEGEGRACWARALAEQLRDGSDPPPLGLWVSLLDGSGLTPADLMWVARTHIEMRSRAAQAHTAEC